jgi:GT2 family glycosyltransferase
VSGRSLLKTIAVIVPTFRRPEELAGLLKSLFCGTRVPDEVIVVDNDPVASCEVAWPADWPVTLLRAGLGLNLAGARNRGWQAAKADLCVFIDDDNTVGSETLGNLAEMADLQEVGFVGPVIFDANAPSRIWCAGVRRSMWTTRNHFFAGPPTTEANAAFWPTADMPDAFAVPRAILDHLSGFDERRFPYYYDEADIGERIRAIGFQTIVSRNASVWHSGNVTQDPGLEMMRAYEMTGPRRVQLMIRSRVFFHRRHSKLPQKAVALGVFIPIYALLVVFSIMRVDAPATKKAGVIRAVFSGLVEGYTQ